MSYLGQHRAHATQALVDAHREELEDELGPFSCRERSPDDYTDPVVLLTTEAGAVFHARSSDHHADARLIVEEA